MDMHQRRAIYPLPPGASRPSARGAEGRRNAGSPRRAGRRQRIASPGTHQRLPVIANAAPGPSGRIFARRAQRKVAGGFNRR